MGTFQMLFLIALLLQNWQKLTRRSEIRLIAIRMCVFVSTPYKIERM